MEAESGAPWRVTHKVGVILFKESHHDSCYFLDHSRLLTHFASVALNSSPITSLLPVYMGLSAH